MLSLFSQSFYLFYLVLEEMKFLVFTLMIMSIFAGLTTQDLHGFFVRILATEIHQYWSIL